MSCNFYFHPFFRTAGRLERTLRVIGCFVDNYEVDELILHPPRALFRHPSLARYPRTYHIPARDCLEVDTEAIARADTALVGKLEGSPLGHADISPARLCAYVARWSEPFGLDFAISDRITGRFIANLSLRLNDEPRINLEDAVCGPIIMGPSIQAYGDDLFRFLDLLAPVLAVDGLALGIVAMEAYPRIDDAIVLAASRERLCSLQIAEEEVTVLDEACSGSGMKLFLRSGDRPI